MGDFLPTDFLTTDLFFYRFCIKGLIFMVISYIFLNLNRCIQLLMKNEHYYLVR